MSRSILSGCFEQLIILFATIFALFALGGVETDMMMEPAAPPETVMITPVATPAVTPAPSTGAETIGIGLFEGEIAIGDYDVWLYEGVAGEIISIEVRALNPANEASQEERQRRGLLDTYVLVFTPEGAPLAEEDDIEPGIRTDTQISELVLPETGIYQIEVRSWSNSTGGAYTLSIKSNQGAVDLDYATDEDQ